MAESISNKPILGFRALGSLLRHARTDPENFLKKPNVPETLEALASLIKTESPHHVSLAERLLSADQRVTAMALSELGAYCRTHITGLPVVIRDALKMEKELFAPELLPHVAFETAHKADGGFSRPLISGVTRTPTPPDLEEIIDDLRELRSTGLFHAILKYHFTAINDDQRELAYRWMIWGGIDAYPDQRDLTREGLHRLILLYSSKGQEAEACRLERQTVVSYIGDVSLPPEATSHSIGYYQSFSLSLVRKALAGSDEFKIDRFTIRDPSYDLLVQELGFLLQRHPHLRREIPRAEGELFLPPTSAEAEISSPEKVREDVETILQRSLLRSWSFPAHQAHRTLQNIRLAGPVLLIEGTEKKRLLDHLEFFLVFSFFNDASLCQEITRILLTHGRKESLLKIASQSLQGKSPHVYLTEWGKQVLVDRGIAIAAAIREEGAPLLDLLMKVFQGEEIVSIPSTQTELLDPSLSNHLRAALAICEIAASAIEAQAARGSGPMGEA